MSGVVPRWRYLHSDKRPRAEGLAIRTMGQNQFAAGLLASECRSFRYQSSQAGRAFHPGAPARWPISVSHAPCAGQRAADPKTRRATPSSQAAPPAICASARPAGTHTH